MGGADTEGEAAGAVFWVEYRILTVDASVDGFKEEDPGVVCLLASLPCLLEGPPRAECGLGMM